MNTIRHVLLDFDRKFIKNSAGIIGIDEVGRGAFAGPVVAAVAWLSNEFYNIAEDLAGIDLINDSKILTALKREEIFLKIQEWESRGLMKYSWAESSVAEIEEYNIIGATRLAMKRALKTVLKVIPKPFQVTENYNLELWDRLEESKRHSQAKILVDGLPLTPFEYPHQAIIEGDAQSLAIATASIIAKVNRDRLMINLAEKYFGYGFECHKGYGTESHREALIQKGFTEIHRKKFLRNLNLSLEQELGQNELF